MPNNEKFAKQMRRARKQYELRHGDIRQEDIGARVARWLGDPEPYSRAMVSRWMNGDGDPSFSVGFAIFAVLEADLAEAARATYIRRDPAITAKEKKGAKGSPLAGIKTARGKPATPPAKRKRTDGKG